MRIATTVASLLLAADATGQISTGTFTPPGKKAIPAGACRVLYTRSYSPAFKPINGDYNPDMLGRLYINVEGHGHFRSTRVVESVTVSRDTKTGVRTITGANWSTNPADANSFAAGDVSKSLQDLGFLDQEPLKMTYNNYDDEGNVESTSPQWERCENPDPIATAVSTTTALFGS